MKREKRWTHAKNCLIRFGYVGSLGKVSFVVGVQERNKLKGWVSLRHWLFEMSGEERKKGRHGRLHDPAVLTKERSTQVRLEGGKEVEEDDESHFIFFLSFPFHSSTPTPTFTTIPHTTHTPPRQTTNSTQQQLLHSFELSIMVR